MTSNQIRIFNGATAIVTGVASGIGRALAGELAKRGAEVVLAIIIMPSWWRLFWWMNRLFPSLGIHLAAKNFQKMQKELGIAGRD